MTISGVKNTWRLDNGNESSGGIAVGFAFAFKFAQETDLRQLSLSFEEGVAICAAKCVGGVEHAQRITIQARESWRRGIFLARNRSIDLLMRLTCQSQISTAVSISELDKIKEVALVGVTNGRNAIDRQTSLLLSAGASRDDSLLDLSDGKKEYLKKIHKLPKNCSDIQLLGFLEEKAALLALSK